MKPAVFGGGASWVFVGALLSSGCTAASGPRGDPLRCCERDLVRGARGEDGSSDPMPRMERVRTCCWEPAGRLPGSRDGDVNAGVVGTNDDGTWAGAFLQFPF